MRDITLGETIDFKFTTTEPDTGAPATLSGSPVISAYVGNSTTQITAGITLTVDFDGVTGLNNVRVVATSGNGYTDATDVALIITTGTVDGNSAVGYKVAEFTIGRSAAHTRIGSNGSGLTGIPWNASWDAEVQSECTDALNAYDPPTNAEMEARTLASASYATATNLATVDTVVDGIKAVTDNLPDSGALTSLATAAALATVDGNVDSILEDTGTTLPGTLSTIAGYIDTEIGTLTTNLATVDTVVDGIKAVTDLLPDSGALSSLATAANLATVDTVVDAIKAKTDSLTFTVAGVVDSNVQRINDVTITGNGQVGTEFGV